jgi:hypothetical protein
VNCLNLLKAECLLPLLLGESTKRRTAAAPHRCVHAPASQAPHPVLKGERSHARITTHKRATCTAKHNNRVGVVLSPHVTNRTDRFLFMHIIWFLAETCTASPVLPRQLAACKGALLAPLCIFVPVVPNALT